MRRLIPTVLAATLLFAGCHECPMISQVVTAPADDDQVQPLIDLCKAHVPDGASGCSRATNTATSTSDAVECGCLALCRHLLEVVDQFPGNEALLGCGLLASPDAGWAPSVRITYRPSTCQ